MGEGEGIFHLYTIFLFTYTHIFQSGFPMDQAFEKAYNKPAKSQPGIIGISRQRQLVNGT